MLPGNKDSTVSVRRDLGLTGVVFAGTRAVLDGLFTTVLVFYFFCWWQAKSSCDASSRSCRILATSGKAIDISQQIEAEASPLSDPEVAALKLIEIANGVEAVQGGTYIRFTQAGADLFA